MKYIVLVPFYFIITLKTIYSLDECFSLIKVLSEKDTCLSSRIELKSVKSKLATNSKQFVALVKNIECNGTAYSCGNTMSWISEVFLGLESQFQESKYDNGLYGGMSGYELAIGEELTKLFEVGKLQDDSIIYQLRHTGTEDHV